MSFLIYSDKALNSFLPVHYADYLHLQPHIHMLYKVKYQRSQAATDSLISHIFPVFADEEDLENPIDFSYITSSSSEIITEPSINSRAAIVLDRNSGLILYGKNEN